METHGRQAWRTTALTAAAAAAATVLWWQRRQWHRKRDNTSSVATTAQEENDNDKDLFPRGCPYEVQVRLAIHLARQAGRNIQAYADSVGTQAQTSLQVDVKSTPADFCTQVDVQNERLVIDGIKHVFPMDDIIGEEGVGTGEIPALSTENPTWIIDPIDGTTNFASGLPLTCVSIGYCVRGKPVVGVVYAPLTHEWYVGVDGAGAFRNGSRIAVPLAGQRRRLADAVVCFEWGYPRQPEAVRTMLAVVEHILLRGCRATRQLGSGVLDLCHVATGRLDAVYAGVAGEGWKPWDYAAAAVIVQEAGAVLHNIQTMEDNTNGSGFFDLYAGNHICAVNAALFRELRSILVENVQATPRR